MKKLLWIPAIIVLVAGLYGVLYLSTAHGMTTVSRDTYAPTRNVTIDARNADVRVTQSNSAKLVVKQAANVKYAAATTVDNSTTVTEKQGVAKLTALQHLFPTKIQMTVYLPANYAGVVRIKTASGAIQLQNISAQKVAVRSASGSISGELTAKQLTARADSSAVKLTANELAQSSRVTTASGSVKLTLKDTRLRRVDAQSASGGVKVDGFAHVKRHVEHHLSAGATSGALLTVKTASGAIDVQ